jgi:RNA polymerase sigma-70 factor (ECF subfamily)
MSTKSDLSKSTSLMETASGKDDDRPVTSDSSGSPNIRAKEPRARAPRGCSDRNAFLACLAEHYSAIYRDMLKKTGLQEAAEDATQEAFARAWAHWDDTVCDHPNPRAWLRRVATNYYVSELRKWRLRWATDLQDAEALRDLIADPPLLPLEPQVTAAIRNLPPRQQQVLLLRGLGNFTIPEVAEVLGIAEGTASNQLCRARRALRPVLREAYQARRA